MFFKIHVVFPAYTFFTSFLKITLIWEDFRSFTPKCNYLLILFSHRLFALAIGYVSVSYRRKTQL